MFKNWDLVTECAKIGIWLPNVQELGFGYQLMYENGDLVTKCAKMGLVTKCAKKWNLATKCAKTGFWLQNVQKLGFGTTGIPNVQKLRFGYQLMYKNWDLVTKCAKDGIGWPPFETMGNKWDLVNWVLVTKCAKIRTWLYQIQITDMGAFPYRPLLMIEFV